LRSPRLLFIACLILLAPHGVNFGQAPRAVTPPSTTCMVDATAASQGDVDLLLRDYAAAEAFYQSVIAAGDPLDEGRLGVARIAIAQFNAARAAEVAGSAAQVHPQSATAYVALAESDIYRGDFAAAQKDRDAAMRLKPCDGRVRALEAKLAALASLPVTAARLLEVAHKLRPNDPLIQQAWLATLSPAAQSMQIGTLLAASSSMPARERAYYVRRQRELEVEAANSCAITTQPRSARLPFQPLTYHAGYAQNYGVEATLAGRTMTLLIGSSDGGIIVSPALAKRLNLIQDESARTGDLVSHVDAVQVGGILFSHCMVTIAETPGADGIIGLALFKPWIVTLDYQGKELRLDPLPPLPGASAGANPSAPMPPTDRYIAPEMAAWLKLVPDGNSVLVPVTLNGHAPQYAAISTSERWTSFSINSTQGLDVRRVDPWDYTLAHGGGSKEYGVYDVLVSIGPYRLPKSGLYLLFDPARTYDPNPEVRTLPGDFDPTRYLKQRQVQVSGLIGAWILSRFTIAIDYRDNLVKLDFDPTHAQNVFVAPKIEL
jgi:tetratricopeptide (TPR) repeat protein